LALERGFKRAQVAERLVDGVFTKVKIKTGPRAGLQNLIERRLLAIDVERRQTCGRRRFYPLQCGEHRQQALVSQHAFPRQHCANHGERYDGADRKRHKEGAQPPKSGFHDGTSWRRTNPTTAISSYCFVWRRSASRW